MEWRLLFSGTQSPLWTASVCFAVAAAVFLFFVLRRYEARLVSKQVGLVLLVLRVLVLVLLLATLLQPVLTRAWTVETQSRLVVGVDVSESMDTVDRHASPAEMLRWAQALGMLGNADTKTEVEQWIKAYDEGRQPDFAENAADGEAAADQPASVLQQHVDGVFDEFSSMPRLEFVRRLLEGQPRDLLNALSEEQPVELRLFGMEAHPASTASVGDVLEAERSAADPTGSDLVSMLSKTIAEEQSERISGIVLISDGRQTVDQDTAAEAQRLASLGIPVYTVPVGSQLLPRDLSIASIDVPQSVFQNDSAAVRATITSVGYAGDEVTVRLVRDDVTIDQRAVRVSADYFEVDFDIPTDTTGAFDYTIEADLQRGELRDDNNSRGLTVSVVDNKSRVLLVEGSARWEFRYLNSALERDRQVELQTTLFDQPSLELLDQAYLSQELPAGAELQELLSKTDILVVGDVAPAFLPEDVWQAVEAAVANDGMTLLVLPGKQHMPHSYQSATFERLLPVTDPRQQVAERYRRSVSAAAPSVFHLSPTPAARDVTFFRLSDPGDAGPMALDALPGHPWAYTGMAKPIASTWAHLKLDGEAVDELPAVVHQYYGFGQVVWLGIDSTWRWRFRAGDKWHHRFWGQLVRWATRNKSAAGNDQVRMTTSDLIITEEEGVDVSVRWNPQLTAQLDGEQVKITIKREPSDAADDDGAHAAEAVSARTIELHGVNGAPEHFAARVDGLEPGEYQIRLEDVGAIKLNEPVVSRLLVTKRVSQELANISCNRDLLQQLATTTEGRLLEPWQLDPLADLVRPQQASEGQLQEKTLWDHWITMLLFFLLLSTEWIVRKMNGLP